MFIQISFYFHPYLEKIPILTNIFQMGWNHQLEFFFQHFVSFVHVFSNVELKHLYQANDWPVSSLQDSGF